MVMGVDAFYFVTKFVDHFIHPVSEGRLTLSVCSSLKMIILNILLMMSIRRVLMIQHNLILFPNKNKNPGSSLNSFVLYLFTLIITINLTSTFCLFTESNNKNILKDSEK